MTLEEFRKKGRLGCAHDYRVFAEHLGELLERIHGSKAHSGRRPAHAGLPAPKEVPAQAKREREERIQHLRAELENAIRQEAYESAARLRDELKAIEERS
jgi:protein arginine kinase activator